MMNRNFFFYIITVIVFGSLIWLVLQKGDMLKAPANNSYENQNVNSNIKGQENQLILKTNSQPESYFDEIKIYITAKLTHPVIILILQILTIIILSRILGMLAAKIGQPTVIGEIFAGILLGPSLLGLYFPDFFSFIFPNVSLKNLEILSQIGLVLFMFIIGMELDIKILRIRAKSAMIISHASIIIAFFFGVCLAYILYEDFAPNNSNFTHFALFIGIAMSIAAFPVLARILQERGLTKTFFGKTIITIAAIDDLTAWCLLAIIVAVIQAGSPISAVFAIVMSVAYIALMFYIVQPAMKKIGSIYITKEVINKKIVAVVFFILFFSAFFAETIGIKALFGGFLAGVIMPQNQQFKKIMAEKIEDFSLVVLLPIFFVFTGLRTQIDLLSEGNLWAVCIMIISFAVIGKFGGSFFAARFTGQSLKNSLFIGTLMNTRGLMELIVLNIGYDIGILSPQIFTMMVIMTIVTTFITCPILNIIESYSKKDETIADFFDKKIFNVLISFGNPKMGASLMKILYSISGKEKLYHKVSALHLTPHTEIKQSDAIKYEYNSFVPIKTTARNLNIKFKTLYKTTEDVTKEILKTAKNGKYNLLLLGSPKPTSNKNILRGRVKTIIEQCKCNVGVLIDNDFKDINNVLLIADRIYFNNVYTIADRLINNSECKITFMCAEGVSEILPENILNIERLLICKEETTESLFFKHFDLIIANYNNFERFIQEHNNIDINTLPSLLLVSFKDNTFNTNVEN